MSVLSGTTSPKPDALPGCATPRLVMVIAQTLTYSNIKWKQKWKGMWFYIDCFGGYLGATPKIIAQ